MNALVSTLLGVSVLSAVAYGVSYVYLLKHLRVRHAHKWERLGRPGFGNNISVTISLLRFVWRSDVSLGDQATEKLRKACGVAVATFLTSWFAFLGTLIYLMISMQPSG